MGAALAAAVVAGTAALVASIGGDPAEHPQAAPPATSAPSTRAVAAPKPSKPAVPAVAHERVPAAAPLAFQMKGPAFTIKADVCRMPNVRPLNPPGDQLHTVCWVESDFGVAPGSHSRGTSYILGHAWAQQKLVFNPLSEFAMNHVSATPKMRSGVATYPVRGLTGYRIVLRTRTGVLTYRVDAAYTVAKMEAANVRSLMAETTPNRVVLITCGVKDGVDVDVNVIVYASLASSARL